MAGYGGILTRDPLLMISPMARGGYTPANVHQHHHSDPPYHLLQSSLRPICISQRSIGFFERLFPFWVFKSICFCSVALLCTWSLGLCKVLNNTALLCMIHCTVFNSLIAICTFAFCCTTQCGTVLTAIEILWMYTAVPLCWAKRVRCIFWPLQTLFLLEVKSIVQKNQHFVIS